MKKKKIVIALGHEALGTTLPEQKKATRETAKAVADFIKDDCQIVLTHSNGPAGGDDTYGDGGILPDLSGIYRNSYVGLLRDEPGIYRI